MHPLEPRYYGTADRDYIGTTRPDHVPIPPRHHPLAASLEPARLKIADAVGFEPGLSGSRAASQTGNGGKEALSELAGPTSFAAQHRSAPNVRAGGLSLAWPIAVIALVLYGSLLPFDINWTAYQASDGFGLFQLALRGGTREDILTNLLVYIPVGLALMLYGNTRIGARWARIPFVVLVGAAVSLAAETLQTGIAARVASWTDVGLNALGTAVGAVLGAGLFRVVSAAGERLRCKLAEQPFTVLASILTIGLFSYGLIPFDFITDTSALHASFGRARWDLSHMRPISLGDPPYAQLIAQLSGAAWFAVLGYLLALAARESKRAHVEAIGSAVKHGFVIAGLIEFLQVFTMSHGFDLAIVVLRVLAVLLGAWYAVFLATLRGDSDWRRQPGLAVPTLMLIGLAVFQVLAGFLSSFDPDLLSMQAVDLANVGWVPFEALWRRPMTAAASEAASTLVTHGALAVTLAMILRRIHLAPVWIVTGVVVTLYAIGTEALQSFTVSQTPDLTGPVLALVAVIAASHLHRMVQPARQ